MRNEWLEYATYTLQYNRPQKKDKSLLFSNVALAICTHVVMFILSIPMLISKNWWIWLVLLAVWLIVLLFRKNEKNEYISSILIDGVFCIELPILILYILIRFINIQNKNSLILMLLIITGTCVLFYEVYVFINIYKKNYSNKKQNVTPESINKESCSFISTLSIAGSVLGIVLYKFFSKSISIYEILIIASICLLWIAGFILLQKYFILKILCNKQQ